MPDEQVKFNPYDKKYESHADLPSGAKEHFEPAADGKGFVRKGLNEEEKLLAKHFQLPPEVRARLEHFVTSNLSAREFFRKDDRRIYHLAGTTYEYTLDGHKVKLVAKGSRTPFSDVMEGESSIDGVKIDDAAARVLLGKVNHCISQWDFENRHARLNVDSTSIDTIDRMIKYAEEEKNKANIEVTLERVNEEMDKLFPGQ